MNTAPTSTDERAPLYTGSAHAVSEQVSTRKKRPIGFAPPKQKKAKKR